MQILMLRSQLQALRFLNRTWRLRAMNLTEAVCSNQRIETQAKSWDSALNQWIAGQWHLSGNKCLAVKEKQQPKWMRITLTPGTEFITTRGMQACHWCQKWAPSKNKPQAIPTTSPQTKTSRKRKSMPATLTWKTRWRKSMETPAWWQGSRRICSIRHSSPSSSGGQVLPVEMLCCSKTALLPQAARRIIRTYSNN